jgi:serine/threonine protein kinase/WD40 repeat protein
MMDTCDGRDPVEELAQEFLARFRRGERPALTEYVSRYPALAEDIRELFPALVMMEEARPRSGPPFGPCSDRVTGDGRPPERLGDYRVIHEVGRGGMGIVYEAEQESLGRHVALKVLPFSMALDPHCLLRFRREARAAARLHHTNIVPVYDVGQHEGVHYYAMQFIHGRGLDQVIAELSHLREKTNGATSHFEAAAKPISAEATAAASMLSGQFEQPDSGPSVEPLVDTVGLAEQEKEQGSGAVGDSPYSALSKQSDASGQSNFQYYRSVARIGVQVADALSYAHGQRVMHRDIKPANLLLDARGTVWVTDFGLAKGDGDDITRSGTLVGTLRYMAPERLLGRADPRSDIYSLGLTLYELLALRPAFPESDRVVLMRRINNWEPPPIHKFDPHVPRDLETVILKAQAKEPSHRYQSAEELADDLRRFLSDRPIRARRVRAAERMWRWCRRNPLVAGLAGTVIALFILILAGAEVAHFLRLERDRAKVAEARAVAAEREVKILSHLTQATAHRRSGKVESRSKSLHEIREAVKLEPSDSVLLDLRNEAIAALALTDVRFGKSWPVGQTVSVAFDSSYRRYAHADDKEISVGRVETDRLIADFRVASADAGLLVFSPDAKWLAVSSRVVGSELQIWDVDRAAPILAKPISGCIGFDFSPDSRSLALCRNDGSVYVIDLAHPADRVRIPISATPYSVAFGPDGSRIAVGTAGAGGALQIWDVHKRSLATEMPMDDGTSIHHIAWHPDGNRVALGLDINTDIWDVKARRRIATFEGHRQPVTWVRFNPTGDLLTTSSWDGTTRAWEVATGRQLFLLPMLQSNVWSRDGSTIGASISAGVVRLVELDRGLELLTLESSYEAGKLVCLSGSFHPAGRVLALGTNLGVRFFDLGLGRELAGLELDLTQAVFFGGGGHELITAGHSGLHRWPMVGDNSGNLRVGPPESLPAGFAPQHGSSSTDGRRLVISRFGQAEITDRETGKITQIRPPNAHDQSRLSPDGRWLATFGWHDGRVILWDAASSRQVRELTLESVPFAGFSPDSRQLVTTLHDNYSFWDIETLSLQGRIGRESCPFPGWMAFSPRNKMMAAELSPGVVHLLDLETAEPLAKLEGPPTVRISHLQVSPDGSKLVALSADALAFRVWDLRQLRKSLAALGVDWDRPPFPEEDESATASLTIAVDQGMLRDLAVNREKRETIRKLAASARRHARQKRWLEAIADQKKILEISPNEVASHNNLAWLLATCPEAALRNAEEAVALAKRAAALEPKSEVYSNTLGVAYFRAGNWRASIDELNRSDSLRPGKDLAYNAFFLAMAHWQLGEKDAARQWFNRAVAWLVKNTPTPDEREELDRFRAEAEKLLQVKPGQ